MAEEAWKNAKVDQSADVTAFKPEEQKANLEKRPQGDQYVEYIIKFVKSHPIAGWWVSDKDVENIRKAIKAIADAVAQVIRSIAFPVHAYSAADLWENDIGKPNTAAKARVEKTTTEITETWKDDAAEVYKGRSEQQTKAMEATTKIAAEVKKNLQELAKTITSFYLGVVACVAGYIAGAFELAKSLSEIDVGAAATAGATKAWHVISAIASFCAQIVEKLAILGKDALAMVDQQVKTITELKGKVQSEFPEGWPKAVSSNMSAASET